jgi:hypothetical protein
MTRYSKNEKPYNFKKCECEGSLKMGSTLKKEKPRGNDGNLESIHK